MLEAFIQFPFLQRAMLAAVLVGLLCGIMGVFLVFNRMSFFADAIAHSALTGIAIGLILGVAPFWAAMVFGLLVAVATVYLKDRAKLNIDTVLGLFLPFSMAIAVLLLGLRKSYTPDLLSYLFGNILAVSSPDLIIVATLLVISLFWLKFNYQKMLAVVLDRDLAVAAGIDVIRLEYIFMAIMSLIVVASIQVIGIILVGGLLVIPAAAAKNIATSFWQLIIIAGVIGVLSAVLGLILSYVLDIASGSAIIVVASLIFIGTFLMRKK